MLLKRNSYRVAIYILILSIIIALRDIAGLEINKILIIAFCTGCFLTASYEELVEELFFTFPLLCGLPGNYIMPIALILMMVKKRKISKKPIILFTYFTFVELLSAILWTNFEIMKEVGYLVNLFLFFVLIYNNNDYKIDKCLSLYVLGLSFVSFIIICSTLVK